MRFIASVALVASLSAPAFCADLVVTRTKHEDATKSIGGDKPASDTTEVTWFGKDKLRMEAGTQVTIVRADLKKMYILDTKAKTATTLDLPFEMKKYLPPDMAPMIEQAMGQVKVTVTPTTETKKIKDWNATKYTMTLSGGRGASSTQDIWTTKDVEFDHKTFNELSGAMLSIVPGGQAIADGYKKLDGMPVLVESTRKGLGQDTKTREEVTAIETKEPPEGLYEVPKGYTEKPFDPMAEMMRGEGGPGGRPKGPPPIEKPKEKG